MRIFGISLMGCFIFSLGALADIGLPDLPQIKEVNLQVEHVYVPKGFDSNDNSEVVVTGWYPTPCYEWSRAVVHKEQDSLNVNIKAFVKEGMDTVCIDMAVPYVESVKLGALREGRLVLTVDAIKSHIEVTKASSSSNDDYLYGQVRRVSSEGKDLVLEIELPSTCIELDRIQAVSNGIDTCSILPIMKKVKDICPRNPQTIKQRFPMPAECLKTEKVLFHVRSLEGKAVNFLFKNK